MSNLGLSRHGHSFNSSIDGDRSLTCTYSSLPLWLLLLKDTKTCWKIKCDMIQQVLKVTTSKPQISIPKVPKKPFVPSLTLAAHSDLMNQGNSVFVFDLFMPVSGRMVVALALPMIQLLQTVFWCGAYFDPSPGHSDAFWRAEKVLRLIPACCK